MRHGVTVGNDAGEELLLAQVYEASQVQHSDLRKLSGEAE
jgi:hypothetical protein